MALNSIEVEWLRFAKMIFKKKPHQTQYVETKKAFYAGNWSMFTAIEEIGEPHTSEAEAEAFLTARKKECEAFRKRLMVEYAERN